MLQHGLLVATRHKPYMYGSVHMCVSICSRTLTGRVHDQAGQLYFMTSPSCPSSYTQECLRLFTATALEFPAHDCPFVLHCLHSKRLSAGQRLQRANNCVLAQTNPHNPTQPPSLVPTHHHKLLIRPPPFPATPLPLQTHIHNSVLLSSNTKKSLFSKRSYSRSTMPRYVSMRRIWLGKSTPVAYSVNRPTNTPNITQRPLPISLAGVQPNTLVV